MKTLVIVFCIIAAIVALSSLCYVAVEAIRSHAEETVKIEEEKEEPDKDEDGE